MKISIINPILKRIHDQTKVNLSIKTLTAVMKVSCLIYLYIEQVKPQRTFEFMSCGDQINIAIVCSNRINIIMIYNNSNTSTNITIVYSTIILRGVLRYYLVLKNNIKHAQDMCRLRASFAVTLQYRRYSYIQRGLTVYYQ